MAVLALKVDIDTYQGMKEGLPRIIEILERRDIKASFFVSFGPDRSGLAALQLLRPRFLYKMLRTNAPGMYGFKTALYGTLLPAPMIGLSFPESIRELVNLKHEVACHAWDHRLWQDWLPLMSEQSINNWFKKMIDSYVEIIGDQPLGFGAPAWRMDSRVLRIVGGMGFFYLSCTRAQTPFIFEENDLLEIPSNLPCIEEVGVEGVLKTLKSRAESTVPHVLPVHTEVEGGIYKTQFEHILDTAKALGYTHKRLIDIATETSRSNLPKRALKQGKIPGRAFKCSV